MQYPLISEYKEAILDAEANFDKLANLRPVLDCNGEPVMSSGNFAVVFKMTDGNNDFAIKCFTKEQEGRRQAYEFIAEELERVDSSYITTLKYFDKELFVDTNCDEEEFPVLMMDWIEGESMEMYIADNYQNSYLMAMLCYRFCKMAAWLRSQPFAHGDLKPDNIMIRPDGSLTLVDYDGMFIPKMKGLKSPTIGTTNFSHPLRTTDDFDETIDDFSLACIALSLKAISLKPSLYTEYCVADRLLFSAEDYRDLSKSKIIQTLQEFMYDKDFCNIFALFLIALARKELSLCPFRLFLIEKPLQPVTVEVWSAKKTDEDLKEALIDDWGVKYSKDGRKLLEIPWHLSGAYHIREGVRVICDNVFCGCSLDEIFIPDGVICIGNSAFGYCKSLTSIVIPDTLCTIYGNPFLGWDGELKCQSPHFVYEDGILFDSEKKKIIAFRKKTESYTIPNGVTTIGNGAFWSCGFLTSIVIPYGVTCIEDCAFYSCESLTNIVIPDSVTSIGDSAFYGCESLTNIVIPDSVVNIGDATFYGCVSLISIVMSNSVKSIGSEVFGRCISLTNIVIPKAVCSIEGNPFLGWNGELKCQSPHFVYEDDILFDSEKKKIIAFRKGTESYTIPYGVISIGNYAFGNCKSLTSITFPDSITNIGDGAFSGCDSLISIVIPNRVTSIGDGAFYGCVRLTNIVIPDSVVSIGNVAFHSCESLTNIVIPDSVKSIGNHSFVRCNSLSEQDKRNITERFGRKAVFQS